MDIDLRVPAPPDPERTLKLAEALPELVRALNHATLDHAALGEPQEAERLFRALAITAQRFPQLLGQIVRWIDWERIDGKIAVTSGDYAGRPRVSASVLAMRRDAAIARAEDLAKALGAMAEVTSGLAGADPEGEGGGDE